MSTGLPELDRLLRGLIPGDNVVFRVNDVADYAEFVPPYAEHGVRAERPLVYFRFARHEPLLPENGPAHWCTLDPAAGFEPFLERIHHAIENTTRRAYYVFDCLSDLAADWYSDRMLSNFFMLTCPYLYDRGDLAYFGLLRHLHSNDAVHPINDTAQVFLDVHRHRGKLYLRPHKVQQRYSPTMHMLHVWDKNTFEPVTESYTITEILAPAAAASQIGANAPHDLWNRTFLEAEEALRRDQVPEPLFERLLRMVVSRDERVLGLARQYLTPAGLLEIGRRTIGTGLIGGKSVGMLLSRAILRAHDPMWNERLEMHDSFYIASDVFYSFLVRNGCWWARRQQRDPMFFLAGAEQVRRRIITGTFMEETEAQFAAMLDYFGQSPIIVRSSSLLEDNFGNSFAGKYESVFCANQGSSRQRLEDFKSAVKTIYASSMSEDALAYRHRHGLLDQDEQMALLVQRVSGSLHDNLFYPHVAGVGFSFNPYVWSPDIDPAAGLLRLVFGLGTRAVDRSDDDYTRIVSLSAPERRPEGARENIRRYAQRKVDVIDLDANQLVSVDFYDMGDSLHNVPMNLFAGVDAGAAREARQSGRRGKSPMLLTFDKLLKETTFVEDTRTMLNTLESAYGVPVDMEFTANFLPDQSYHLDIVQCRPLHVKGYSASVRPPDNVNDSDVLLQTTGPVIGQSRIGFVERVILVEPAAYAELPVNDRYAIARLIGQLTHLTSYDATPVTMLLGPGRWGTQSPSLGVPVSFSEINTVSVLCEIVAMRDDLVPDVSLGTHFFSELVEVDMLYLALFPGHEGHQLKRPLIDTAPNRLTDLLPEAERLAHIVKVFEAEDLTEAGPLKIYADTVKQRALCYRQPEDPEAEANP